MKKLLLVSLCFLVLCVTQVFAQNRTVTGTVTAKDDGLPIPGVTVKIKGTTTGVPTDVNGKYSINAPEGSTLVFSFIAFVPQEVPVTGRSVINISLAQNFEQLSEVVVTANAIKREKRTLGYSAPTISNKELLEGGNPSVLTSISGRVAGVNITSSSNTPGSSTRVVLRGGSSISGSNQALIVVDGIPIDNSSIIGSTSNTAAGAASPLASVDFGNRGNDIDPDDVESVTVLKGPGAAALYGSRASNGALIITTKSGGLKGPKTQVTFSTSNTFSSILKLPDLQNEYGQGYYDVVAPDRSSATYVSDPNENFSWGAPFDGQMKDWGQEIDGVRQSKPYVAQPNNLKNFFTTGFSNRNHVDVSGGDEKTGFYMGLNNLNYDGVYPGSKDVYNKYGVRFNGKTELGNKFYAGISFNYNKINAQGVGGGQGGSSAYNNLLQTPRDIPIDKMGDLNNKYNAYGFTGADGVARNDVYGFYGAYTVNPYWILQNYDNFNSVDRVTGNFNLGYKPTSWLNIQERLGVDNYTDQRRYMVPKYAFAPADEAGNYTAKQTSNGGYQIDQFNVNEIVHDLMVTATHNFTKDFKGSLMLGNNIRQRSAYTNKLATNASGGLVVPDWYNMANSNGPLNIIQDQISKRRSVSFYADLNLSYKNYLFLEGTVRNDRTSTLFLPGASAYPKGVPLGNYSYYYPSVSGSFVFSELLKDTGVGKVLTYGKLRSSYAQVGNDTDPYQLLSSYARGTINSNFGSTIFPFGNVTALQAGSLIGNPNLKPEQTSQFEVGTELGFFGDRLSVDFSYYAGNSKNQILSIPIPNSTGYGTNLVNAGKIENKGIELGLRGTPIRTSYGLNWELYGTFTKNNSKVVELMDGVDQILIDGYSGMSIVAAKGRPYGEFYGVTDSKDAQGRTIVDKATGLPVPTTTAQYLGTYNPRYQASLGTALQYKGFNVNVLFDIKQGGVFYSRTKDITSFNGTAAITGGKRFGEVFPNSVYLDAGGNSVVNNDVYYVKQDYFSDLQPGMHMVDASYVKMRTVGIAYSFNKAQLKSLPFGALTIGIYGNNLFMWTPKDNAYADPEVSSTGAGNGQGFDYTAQPSVRNYGFNVKVSF